MPGVRASQLRRDADLSSDDNVQLLIDSFNDRRSAFVFGTNPNGAMWDAQFSGVDDLNENWNGIWEVAVSRDNAGWTAEFRIPLLALRFHAGTDTEFGFNVRRFIRRKNEEDLWRSSSRTQGFYRLHNGGTITNLGVLNRPLALVGSPIALGRAAAWDPGSAGRESSAFSTGRPAVRTTTTTPSCGSSATSSTGPTSAPSGHSTPDPAAKASSGRAGSTSTSRPSSMVLTWSPRSGSRVARRRGSLGLPSRGGSRPTTRTISSTTSSRSTASTRASPRRLASSAARGSGRRPG